MRTELWGLRNTETQELVLTYWASSQKHKALFSTREKAEDACKHNPQYEPFRIEAEPVKHGRWIFTNKHLWCKDEDGNVDEWEWDAGFHNGPECQVCHATPCVHCTPNWAETECEKGHYYCSECGETSKDAHENYCPNCGAKMDGGAVR